MLILVHTYSHMPRKYCHKTALTPDDYPLHRKHYTLSNKKFVTLIKQHDINVIDFIPYKLKYKNSIETFKGKYLLIQEDWNKYEELNNVTDYFSEVVRIQCNFKNNISPFDYWVKFHDELIDGSTDKYGKFHIDVFRDAMYNSTKFCNNFRISVALSVYKLFNAKNILDPSAGWGDRLLGAIGHGVESYVGVDPNEQMHPHYDAMIKMLVAPEKQKNFTMINDGFETAIIPNNKYDLVFTSPPFFDLESYSKSEKDSIIAYPTFEQWYNKFLLVMLKKSCDNLIVGGHMVLYMSDTSDNRFMDNMLSYIDNLLEPCGSIYYFYTSSYTPRRMYVWKKVQ